MASAPPSIFSNARRFARRRRMLTRHADADAARFIEAHMVDDIVERLAFVRAEPAKALVIGEVGNALADHLSSGGAAVVQADTVSFLDRIVIDLEQPFPHSGFDLIAVLGVLDTVNDLPGALIHLHRALAPGGRIIASFPGAGSLPQLRAIMLEADGERPAARTHPLVDSRAGAQLLQRAGWSDPVVDSIELSVSYRSLSRLVSDLREQGLGNVLASPAPPLGIAGMARAKTAFASRADDASRVVETFAILTLSGKRSLAGT